MSQTIIIADDEPAINELLTFTLTRRGYVVKCASDGEEAWQLIQSAAPALVILDVMMPKVSGFDLARRMSEDPALATIPIIIASGGVQSPNQPARVTANASCTYLPKPFSPRELGALVDHLLHRGTA